jgi:hypothetical protein
MALFVFCQPFTIWHGLRVVAAFLVVLFTPRNQGYKRLWTKSKQEIPDLNMLNAISSATLKYHICATFSELHYLSFRQVNILSKINLDHELY